MSTDEKISTAVLPSTTNIIDTMVAVFIFTTNYLEKIDSAVYRPGRVDAMIHLKSVIWK